MLIPDRAGVMILGEASLFPQAMLPLFIFEPRYRAMLGESIESHRMFCLAMQKPGSKRETPAPIATLGLVRASVRNDNGTSNLILQGLLRVRLGKVVRYKPYRQHLIQPILPNTEPGSLVLDALVSRILDLVDARLRQKQPVPLELISQLAGSAGPKGETRVEDCLQALRGIPDPGHFADLIATVLLPNPLARQVILQAIDLEERLRHLVHFLLAEVSRGRKASGKE
jgi:ATP-dependent Lon protease